MSTESLIELARKFLNGSATEEEAKALHAWYNNWEDDEEVVVTETPETELQIKERIFAELQGRIRIHEEAQVKVVAIYRRKWLSYAAAAILVVGAASIWFLNKPVAPKEIASQSVRFKNDVKPGGNKAILTLADGKQITLDNTQNGELAVQGTAHIEKTADGQLAYNNTDQKKTPAEVLYNLVSTPKGGQYEVLLADGTKVWLNATSSLKFPTSFPGNQRDVELHGEAYFEVAKNAAKPFHVMVNGMQVEVLGTHFNVMSYENETTTKTTLLEGSVKVNKGSASLLLSPGQQAELLKSGSFKLVKDADIDEAMAWKNGLFRFKDQTIQEIMRQVERWYDVSIRYDGEVTDHFVSTLPRNMTMVQLFTLLEKTGKVHFTIDGRNVTVSQ